MSRKVIYEVGGEDPLRYEVERLWADEGTWSYVAGFGTLASAEELARYLSREGAGIKYRVIDTRPEPDDEYEYRHVCRRTSGCGGA